MATTTTPQALLSDETWAQIPAAHADRRAVGAVLLILLLLLAAIIVGSVTGILVPHLTYEGGSTMAVPRTQSLTVRAIVHNDSSRNWTITGATINAPGTVHEMQTTRVAIPAHETRTVRGVVHVDDCGALTAVRSNQEDASYDIKLRVDRLFGESTMTIRGVFDDQLRALACGGEMDRG